MNPMPGETPPSSTRKTGHARLVGIIANPASGKDIRRLVSRATTVNNHEKVSIVQRVLAALEASGVERIQIMPDAFGIGLRALDGLRDQPGLNDKVSLIDMVLEGDARDSLRASRYLRDAGAGCVVVLGGDGTCRVVSKGCGGTPILPISTGTNNVVPTFVEGTVAGAAAAFVAGRPPEEHRQVCRRHKRLLVHVNGERVDQALVEVAVVSGGFVGARAIWEADRLRQIFVARAQPVAIGLSSTLGMVSPVDPAEPHGAVATFSSDGRKVTAPIAPGAFVTLGVERITSLNPGIPCPIEPGRPEPSGSVVLGLDGEREIVLHPGDEAEVTLDLDGPWIVDVARAMARAVESGAFLR